MEKENDEAVETEPKQAHNGSKYKFFGIKSYLHNFYDNSSTTNEEDECAYELLLEQQRQMISRHRSTLWIVILTGSFLIMLCGTVMLGVGFAYPEVKIDIGYQEEMRIIDKSAYKFNKHLDRIKVVGLIFFALGGISAAGALLLPSLFKHSKDNHGTHLKVQVEGGDKDDTDGRDDSSRKGSKADKNLDH